MKKIWNIWEEKRGNDNNDMKKNTIKVSRLINHSHIYEHIITNSIRGSREGRKSPQIPLLLQLVSSHEACLPRETSEMVLTEVGNPFAWGMPRSLKQSSLQWFTQAHIGARNESSQTTNK